MTKGEIRGFTLSFVVQANNYHEMPAFAALGESVNASSVMFIQLGNTGVFTKEDYERRAIHLPTHPEHQQLLEVLQDPALGIPIVDLRNFYGLREKTGAEKSVGRRPTQEALLQAVEVIQTYTEQLGQAGIDGTTVRDEECLAHSKAQIRSALDLVISAARTEQEKDNLRNARQMLAFFQSGVVQGQATLDTIAFEQKTWGSVVRAEMLQHAR